MNRIVQYTDSLAFRFGSHMVLTEIGVAFRIDVLQLMLCLVVRNQVVS